MTPLQVIYLPTSFMEDNFNPYLVPVNCILLVEADGVEQAGSHEVTIKSVPRQGLSTMYCMTSVLKFQSNFLNWAVVGWTRVDSQTIKIHLQSQPQGLDSARDDEGMMTQHVAHNYGSEGKPSKRKNLSDSANDEREGGHVDEEDSHERPKSHRGTPRSQRAFKPTQPCLTSQDVELSPANSEGEMPEAPNPLLPTLSSFPPFPPALFPFGTSAFLNPFQASASMPQLGPSPSLAWQMLMGGPYAFPLAGMNPLLMGAASDPLVTMRSSEESQAAMIAAKKKSKS